MFAFSDAVRIFLWFQHANLVSSDAKESTWCYVPAETGVQETRLVEVTDITGGLQDPVAVVSNVQVESADWCVQYLAKPSTRASSLVK